MNMIRKIPKQSTAGFTLLEVLVVVAIIGILFAIAAPGWVTFANRQRSVSGRDQVLQAIRLVQSEARRTRTDRTLEFIPGNAATLPELSVRGARQTLGEGSLSPGMVALNTLSGTGAAVPSITFRADGTLADTTPALPIVITVTAPAGSNASRRCVVIETLLGSTRTALDEGCAL